MIFTLAFAGVMFNLQDTRSKIVKETLEVTNFADGFIYLRPINTSTINPIIEDVAPTYFKDYESRMIINVNFKIDDKDFEGLLVGVDTSIKEHINALVDLGKNELKDIEYTLNWNFANDENVEKGDKITIYYGSIEREIEVKNIGFNPEYLYAPLQKDVEFPSVKPYPVLYVDINYLNRNFLNSSENIVNQIIYKLKNNVDEDDLENTLKLAIGLNLENIIKQKDYYFVKTMREDEENDRQMLLVFTIIFMFGAIITFIVILYRLIEFDLKSISVFQGLGATKKEILGGYLIFNLLIFLIAFIFSAILSNLLTIWISGTIASIMGIPFFPKVTFNFLNVMNFGFLLLTISLLSTILVIRKSFKMDIQQTMRFETKFLEKTPLIEKLILNVKKDLHPFTKYTIRRIFGRKLFLGFLLTALTISSSFLLFAYGFPDSIAYSLDKKVNDTEKWDGIARTWQYQYESDLINDFDTISGIDEFEFGITDTVLFSFDKDKNFDNYLRLIAYQNDAKLHDLEAENNVKLINEGEALVSKDLLHDYSIEIGDQIYIKNVASNKSYNIWIIGDVNDLTESTIYLPLNMAQKVMEFPNKTNTVYFTLKNKDNKRIKEEILDLSSIKEVILKETIKEDFERTSELVIYFTVIMGLLFTIFGLLVIGIIIKNLVDYRLEDYANMKALGLSNKEIQKSISLEVIIYFMIAIPLGIFFGILLTFGLINYYSSIMPGLYFNIYLTSYLYYGFTVFLMILIVLLLQFRKLRKLNIAGLTKTKIFG